MSRVRVKVEVLLIRPARTLGVKLELGHVARAGPDAQGLDYFRTRYILRRKPLRSSASDMQRFCRSAIRRHAVGLNGKVLHTR